MKNFKKTMVFVATLSLLLSSMANSSGRIQNEDVKSVADVKASVLTTIGTVSSGSACVSAPGSLTGLVTGLFVYDSTTPGNIGSGVTIAGLPGTCPSGQIQMSAVALGNGSGDALTFGGQPSQIINTDKIWDSFNSQQLSISISSGALAGVGTASYQVISGGLAASVSSNNLTVSLKTGTGATPSVSGVVSVGFRSPTSTTGQFSVANIASATTITASSGASLGLVDGQSQYIYAYLQYNSGSPELCLSGSSAFDEGSTQTTSTISGAATSRSVLYCSTGRSSQPIRFLGRISLNETTAGVYASSPTEISLLPIKPSAPRSEAVFLTGAGQGSTNTRIRNYAGVTIVGTALSCSVSSTLGASCTVNETGVYALSRVDNCANNCGAGFSVNSTQLTTDVSTATGHIEWVNLLNGIGGSVSSTLNLNAGDVVRLHDGNVLGLPDDTSTYSRARITKISN